MGNNVNSTSRRGNLKRRVAALDMGGGEKRVSEGLVREGKTDSGSSSSNKEE